MDNEKMKEEAEALVEFYLSDCSCEQGSQCDSCKLKSSFNHIIDRTASEAFERGKKESDGGILSDKKILKNWIDECATLRQQLSEKSQRIVTLERIVKSLKDDGVDNY